MMEKHIIWDIPEEYVKVAVPKTEKYGVNDILAVKVEKNFAATYSAGRRNTGSVGRDQ